MDIAVLSKVYTLKNKSESGICMSYLPARPRHLIIPYTPLSLDSSPCHSLLTLCLGLPLHILPLELPPDLTQTTNSVT